MNELALFTGAGGDSEAICSDGEPWRPSKLKNIPEQFYCNGSLTDACLASLSGTTSEPLTVSRGEAGLTSLPEASPARTYQSPERVPELTANAPGSGAKCTGWFAKLGQNGCSWKTPQLSLLGGLEEYSETWPKAGMMRSGVCWEQTMWEPRTTERESGYWATPLARDWKDTPGMSVDGENPDGTKRKRLDQLARQVYHGGTTTQQKWPTPGTTGLSNGSSNCEVINQIAKEGRINETERRSMRAGNGGKLNPNWVEWLMGWPIGWTDLKPLETDRFQQWQQSHLWN